jgi:hypothetical protein
LEIVRSQYFPYWYKELLDSWLSPIVLKEGLT